MRKEMDPTLLSKLPKWAQEYIREVEMQRDAARRELNAFTDNQTESKVWTEGLVCDSRPPRAVRRYIQDHGVIFNLDGDEVYILLREDQHCLEIGTGYGVKFQPWAANSLRVLGVKAR